MLDATVLSNFARIERLELLRLVLLDAATAPRVMTEFERDGFRASAGQGPAVSELVRLTPSEDASLAYVRLVLDLAT